MNIFQLIKSLMEKKFATKEEKENFTNLFKDLSKEEQEVLSDKVKAINDLPDEEPKTDEKEETVNMLKALMSKTSDEIKAELKEWLSSQKELIQKKAGIYSKEAKSSRKEINDKFRGFVKAIYGNDEKLKELTTDATASPYGGYVVDSELSAEIRHIITTYGVARREMSNLTLAKNSYKANTLATDVVVYWVDEGTVVGSTEAVLGQKSLSLKKLGAIATLTRELLEDEEIDLFAFLASRIAEKFAQAEDKAFFVGAGGAGNGGFTGILNDAGVSIVSLPATKVNFSDLTADDLLDLQDAIPASAQSNAKYFLHRTILTIIRKLKASDGHYIFSSPTGTLPGTIWNRPYVLTEVMPTASATAISTKFLLYGDIRQACILGTKGVMEAKQFDAGTVKNVAGNADINLITTDREAIRWVERVGYLAIMPSIIAVLETPAA